MADLTTSYMGLKLRNPIIVASSDLTKSVEGILRCAEAGAYFRAQYLKAYSKIE